jgi:hypothetical protein
VFPNHLYILIICHVSSLLFQVSPFRIDSSTATSAFLYRFSLLRSSLPFPFYFLCSLFLPPFLLKATMKSIIPAVIMTLTSCLAVNAQCESAGIDFGAGSTLYINPALSEPFLSRVLLLVRLRTSPMMCVAANSKTRLPGDEYGDPSCAVSGRHDI